MTVTFIDLFAGCGGLAIGLEQAGLSPNGAVEIDLQAAETYRRNVGGGVSATDIATISSWPRVDVVVGGPPCQGFSRLGSHNPDDPRNQLWKHYVRALRGTGATVFLMENVPQLLASRQFRSFESEVRRLGFVLNSAILNAADFGVPQTRRRAIVIGSRLGPPPMPVPTFGPNSRSRAIARTVRNAFESPPLSVDPDGENWHRARPGVKAYSLVRYAAVPADGGNRFQMQEALEAQSLGQLVPPCWRRKTTGTTDVFGRMWWDRLAPTIRTEFFKPEKGRYLHPVADRPITPPRGGSPSKLQ